MWFFYFGYLKIKEFLSRPIQSFFYFYSNQLTTLMKIHFAIALFFSMSIYSQVSNETKAAYNLYDEIIGLENTALSYGKYYSEKYRTLDNNHQYFVKNDFVKGNVTYQNKTFYNVYLKYNTSEDLLIVKNKNQIALENALVSNFKLYEKDFINTETLGYLEVIYKNEQFNFFKKNKKNKRKKLNESFVYYKFLDKNTYYLKIDVNYYEVENKKDVINHFPELKKLISNTYKTNKKLYKTNTDSFYKLLGNVISKHIKNKI